MSSSSSYDPNEGLGITRDTLLYGSSRPYRVGAIPAYTPPLPCNSSCPACGSKDKAMRYKYKGTTSIYREKGKPYNEYTEWIFEQCRVIEDHIQLTCNTCNYGWALLPLNKDVYSD